MGLDSLAAMTPKRELKSPLPLFFHLNKDACLFHLIDYASRWSEFIHPQTLTALKVMYPLIGQSANWERYRQTRRKLRWTAESNLLRWATQGFPENSTYKELKTSIDLLLAELERNPKPFSEYTANEFPKLQGYQAQIENNIKNSRLHQVLIPLEILFQRNNTHRLIDCFLVFTPAHGFQGGANGNGIMVEIPLNPYNPESIVADLAHTVIHEAIHLLLKPRVYLKSISAETKQFYNKTVSGLYKDTLAGLFDEILTHTIADVVISGVNPEKMVIDYEQDQSAYRYRYAKLWRGAIVFRPIIEDYLTGRLSVEKTRKRIFQASKDFVDRFTTSLARGRLGG